MHIVQSAVWDKQEANKRETALKLSLVRHRLLVFVGNLSTLLLDRLAQLLLVFRQVLELCAKQHSLLVGYSDRPRQLQA